MITVGMNYEVVAGKQDAFEKKFALVVEVLSATPGHVVTHLYKQVTNPLVYLVVSEWQSTAAFEAFVGSEGFRKATAWGQSGILARRPSHQVYGADTPVGAPHSHPSVAHH